MSWKDRFTFRDKRYVEHEIEGRTFRFYPNRMALLQEARDLSSPVAKAISVLFADESRDSGSSVRRTRDRDWYVEDITTEPISQEMASYRQKERDRAIEQILGTLADRRNQMLLGRLLMDSLRDEFDYKPERPISEVEAFLFGSRDDGYDGLDMPVLVGLFNGWMKANAKVFGQSGEKMVGLVKERLAALENSRLMDQAGTDPTSGSSSKSPSSEPSELDSPQSISID